MEEKKINFRSEIYQLVGKLVKPKKLKKTGVLILHGGGGSNKERYVELQNFLAKNKYLSFSFDTRGVGESSGKFHEGSLIKRHIDAQSAYDELSKYVSKIAVIGCSMGGHIATMLSESKKTEKLILLYPAAYSHTAEDLELGKKFTRVLRTPNSWTTSNSFRLITDFGENVLMIYGEKEEIIPEEVQLAYKNSIANKDNFVILKHGTHGLLAPKDDNQIIAKTKAFEKIILFLEEN